MLSSTVRVRLTRGCAEACLHCPDSSRYRAAVEAMSLDALAAGLAAAFAQRDPARTQVIVSGGEPADHPHLLEALALVRGHRVARTKLATNGVRLAADPAFAARVLDAGVDHLLLSTEIAAPGLLSIRSPGHASAAARLVRWLADRPARPHVALNAMVFDAPIARLAPALAELLAIASDELRLLRFDPSELPAAAPRRVAPPTDEHWRALRGWASAQAIRVSCVDRGRTSAIELAA